MCCKQQNNASIKLTGFRREEHTVAVVAHARLVPGRDVQLVQRVGDEFSHDERARTSVQLRHDLILDSDSGQRSMCHFKFDDVFRLEVLPNDERLAGSNLADADVPW